MVRNLHLHIKIFRAISLTLCFRVMFLCNLCFQPFGIAIVGLIIEWLTFRKLILWLNSIFGWHIVEPQLSDFLLTSFLHYVNMSSPQLLEKHWQVNSKNPFVYICTCRLSKLIVYLFWFTKVYQFERWFEFKKRHAYLFYQRFNPLVFRSLVARKSCWYVLFGLPWGS